MIDKELLDKTIEELEKANGMIPQADRFEIRGNGKTLVMRGSSFEIRWSGTRIG